MNFTVIEDNGGHLFCFGFSEENNVIWGCKDLEYLSSEDFYETLVYLTCEEATVENLQWWDSTMREPHVASDLYMELDLDTPFCTAKVVADIVRSQIFTYPSNMGVAAKRAFDLS